MKKIPIPSLPVRAFVANRDGQKCLIVHLPLDLPEKIAARPLPHPKAKPVRIVAVHSEPIWLPETVKAGQVFHSARAASLALGSDYNCAAIRLHQNARHGVKTAVVNGVELEYV